MAREFERSSRVAGQLQRELSELIRREVKDPRVRLVTVTKVDVTRDLSHAKVMISVLGQDGPQPEVLAALQHAAGYLRHLLGKMLKMRSIPEFHFAQDDVLERAAHLTALINQANRDKKGPGETDS
jgi:ribosome-binding factor A